MTPTAFLPIKAGRDQALDAHHMPAIHHGGFIFPGAKGTIEGRLTHHGFNCGAKDEPMTGSFDGSELRLVSRLRADVNVKNAGKDCGSGKTTWTLQKQKKGGFEGKGVWEGGGPSFSFDVDLKP
jgi:hypothetical protein